MVKWRDESRVPHDLSVCNPVYITISNINKYIKLRVGIGIPYLYLYWSKARLSSTVQRTEIWLKVIITVLKLICSEKCRSVLSISNEEKMLPRSTSQSALKTSSLSSIIYILGIDFLLLLKVSARSTWLAATLWLRQYRPPPRPLASFHIFSNTLLPNYWLQHIPILLFWYV